MQWIDTDWNGLPCIRLQSDRYEATVLPDFGANCISLIHRPSGAQLLRVPPSADVLRENPNVYGIPLLFPPNRIRDATYVFDGRTYRFPANDPPRGHHLHGLLSRMRFEPGVEGAFHYHADAARPYLTFPHAFSVTRAYRVDDRGLSHTLTVTNHSDTPMPLGVGFHTALKAPLPEAGNAPGCRLAIPVVRQWLLDPLTLLPTGETAEASPLLCALREGTLCPVGQPLSCLLECAPGPIRLATPQGVWVCERGEGLAYIMLWNAGGVQGFVCPEPQSWLTDAPNRPADGRPTGFDALRPGEQRTYRLRYALE